MDPDWSRPSLSNGRTASRSAYGPPTNANQRSSFHHLPKPRVCFPRLSITKLGRRIQTLDGDLIGAMPRCWRSSLQVELSTVTAKRTPPSKSASLLVLGVILRSTRFLQDPSSLELRYPDDQPVVCSNAHQPPLRLRYDDHHVQQWK